MVPRILGNGLTNIDKFILAVAVCLTLGGCATAPKTDTQFVTRSLKVCLAQVSIQDREAVRSVVVPDPSKVKSDDEQAINKAIQTAQTQALTEMTSAFAVMPGLKVNAVPVVLPSVLNEFPIMDRKHPLSAEVLATLRASSGTDALLRFGISDYGLTPRAWRHGVIAFEVVSTLGIAAIAYANPATRAIAGVYLAQETIEESIEAYSGFWALNEVYRPVRVEAEMIDLQTGRTVWADSEIGFSDRSLSRLYRTVSNEERERQLRTALHDAINKVVGNFQKGTGH